MQKVSINYWPTDNNAMSSFTLEVQVNGLTGVDDQWVRDLADAIAPVVPTEALGWSAPAAVSSISVQDDNRSIEPNG